VSGLPAARLLDLGALSPLRTQALYHGLAERMGEDSPDTVVLCRPAAAAFCVGAHQDPDRELDLAWCRSQGHPVLQRRIGGGTVFLDRQQLFYQVIVHRRRAPLAVEAIYRRFLTPAVESLRALGLAAGLQGVNEIEVGGRRVAGTGGGQIGEAVVVVGNLLLDFPPSVMARAWRAPSAAFRRLALEGLKRHLAPLSQLLGGPPDESLIRRRLVQGYEAALGRALRPGPLAAAEEQAVTAWEGRLVHRGGVPGGGAGSTLVGGGGGSGPGAGVGWVRLKLTRRAWVHEWAWVVGRRPVRVTARLVDGRVEDLVIAGGGLPRDDAERRVLQALAS
jgi:lipoate-protein ligase A